eukprot:g897.t1
MMAQAMMWESSGIGGWFVPVLVLMSYIGGICLSALLDGLFQKDEVNLPEDPPNLEQTLGPPRHSSHFSAGTVTGGVICHSGLLDVVDASGRWWWMAPGFSRPLATVKLYICLLLLTELFSLQIPSGSVLSTPELISLEPHYPEPIPDTPAMAQWLMPGFESNIASWLDFLGGLRWMLLISWCVFLLLPKAHGLWQVVASASYTCGALVFCYFIVLNIMFEGHHCLQATFYFVFSCILALPFLETNPRAANWLWRFLFLTLIPCYLFAGFSKIHFHGLRTNLTGGWLVGVIDGKKGAAPGFVGFVAFLRSAPGILGSAVPWPYMCMSWGNLLVELVLPIAAMLSMKPDKLSTLIRVTFCLAAAGFHVLVLLLKGPNFMHNIVLLIIACNPLCLFDLGRAPPGAQTEDPSKSADRGSQRQQLASWGDRFRSAYAMIILLLWYGADFQNHWNHVTGQVGLHSSFLSASSEAVDAAHFAARARAGSWAAAPSATSVEEKNITCEAFLWEAQEEAHELRRRHEQLQLHFRTALEAATQWVRFLKTALASKTPQDHRLCVEAARPGQKVLQVGTTVRVNTRLHMKHGTEEDALGMAPRLRVASAHVRAELRADLNAASQDALELVEESEPLDLHSLRLLQVQQTLTQGNVSTAMAPRNSTGLTQQGSGSASRPLKNFTRFIHAPNMRWAILALGLAVWIMLGSLVLGLWYLCRQRQKDEPSMAFKALGSLAEMWYFAGALMKKWLMEYDVAFLGVDVSVDRIVLNPWFGTLLATNLTIGNPPGYTSQHLAHVQRLFINVDMGSLVKSLAHRHIGTAIDSAS